MLRERFLSLSVNIPVFFVAQAASAHVQPRADRLMDRAIREYELALDLAWSGKLNDGRSHVLIAKGLYEQILRQPIPFVGGHYLDNEVLLAAIETLMGNRKAKHAWLAAEAAYIRYADHGNDVHSRDFKADELFRRGKTQEAFAVYAQVFSSFGMPYDVAALSVSMRRGLQVASAGDFRGAEISFRRAVTLEPQYDFGLLMLGLTLLCLSNKREACTELAKATIAYFPSMTMQRFSTYNLSAMQAILHFCWSR